MEGDSSRSASDVLIEEHLAPAMQNMLPRVFITENERKPATQFEWRKACFDRWEDIGTLLLEDPHMSKLWTNHTEEPNWERVYAEMNSLENKFFGKKPEQMLAREYHVMVQPPVVVFEGKGDDVHEDEFNEIFQVGCTNRYAIIIGATRKHPDRFDVYRADHTVDRLLCMRTMPKSAPHGPNRKHNINERTAQKLNLPADKCTFYFVPVPGGKLSSRPSIYGLSIETGTLCLVLSGDQGRLRMLNVHANSTSEVMLGTLKLPAGVPEMIACSGEYVALRYSHAHGRLNKPGTKVPEDNGDPDVELLPPHVQVLPLLKPASHKDYSDKQRDLKRAVLLFPMQDQQKAQPGHKRYLRVASMDFNDSLDTVLYVSAADDSIWTVIIDTVGDRIVAEIQPKPTYMSVSAEQILEIQRRKQQSGKELSAADEALLEHKSGGGYRVIRARKVGPLGAEELRIICVGLRHISALSGDVSSADKKRALGKVPAHFLPIDQVCVSVHNCGNLMALHRAGDNGIIIMNFATGEAHALVSPASGETGGNAIRPTETWCQTLRVHSNRVCALLPDGIMLFIEADNDEFTKRYEAARGQVVAELAEEMMRERSKKPLAKQSAKEPPSVRSASLKDNEEEEEAADQRKPMDT